MSTLVPHPDNRSANRQNLIALGLSRGGRCYTPLVMLLGLMTMLISGCTGCRPDETLSRKEIDKRAQEKKKPIEVDELISVPPDAGGKILHVKGGHWIATQQDYKSNREDLQVLATGAILRGDEEVQLPGTDFINSYARRTSLPKGQSKRIGLRFFLPFLAKNNSDVFVNSPTRIVFRTELLNWPLLTPIQQSPSLKPANELKENEFLLYAIGPEALGYDYLRSLDAIFWSGEELLPTERTRSYHVVKVKPEDGKYALPNSMLLMTPVAVIIWDDVAPESLSEGQQHAIVDWLHWGGQLIINGPSSWTRLQNSFLSPYLPARAATSVNLSSGDFAELSDYWQAPDVSMGLRQVEKHALEVSGPAMGGLHFNLSPRGSWLPHTGQMVAESLVGRGRIVLTSFPLRDPRIFEWPSFSSFLSTGLLRRPPRTVSRDASSSALAQHWAPPFTPYDQDPRLHTHVRILSRDLPAATHLLGGDASSTNEAAESPEQTDQMFRLGQMTELERRAAKTAAASKLQTLMDQNADQESGEVDASVMEATIAASNRWSAQPLRVSQLNLPDIDRAGSEALQWGGNGAAWNDFSGLSQAAIESLRRAAGVELPSRSTIVKLLIGYLVCLVPLNWLVFRLLGKVEWAWLAVPVMAGIGVTVVTHVARLDIGFARRTTEIGVLEMYGDYPRGHLTQYIALYTSLSTNYVVDFPEEDAVALPLSDPNRKRRRAASETRRLRTTYGRSSGVRLEPLTVYSNSTEMLHAEQLIQFKGGLRLGTTGKQTDSPPALRNETELDLAGAAVIRRDDRNQVSMAWIGTLPSGGTQRLKFEPMDVDKLWQYWSADPVTQPEEPSAAALAGSETDAMWVGGVLRTLVHNTPLFAGQTRLFAYTSGRFSKLKVTPQEDQYDGRCLVVAHLTPARLPDVKPDLAVVMPPRESIPRESNQPGSPASEPGGPRAQEPLTTDLTDAPAGETETGNANAADRPEQGAKAQGAPQAGAEIENP